jgi:hypothetical protein
MSATGTPTPNLGLRIPLGTDPAAVEDINYNAGVLDTKIGAIGNDTVKGLLDHAGDEINALGDGLAIIANGNTHAAIAAGEFVFVRNHGSLATGLYKATTAIAANGALSSSNLAADSKGGLNSLSDQIGNQIGVLQVQEGLIYGHKQYFPAYVGDYAVSFNVISGTNSAFFYIYLSVSSNGNVTKNNEYCCLNGVSPTATNHCTVSMKQ